MINKIIFNLASISRKMGFDYSSEKSSKIIEMKKAIASIGKIEFKIESHSDGSWTAESTNIDGIITGGKEIKNITDTIKDAIFTYFEIPPHLCEDSLLKADNESVILTQRVYA